MRMLTLILVNCCTLWVSAAIHTQTVDSRLDSVNVFLNGAEISRSTTATVPTGQSIVLFQELSDQLDASSIQITSDADIAILEVTCQSKTFSDTLSPKLQILQDSIRYRQDEIMVLHHKSSALRAEKALLFANKAIGGEQNGIPLDELKKAAKFYRERIQTILDNLVVLAEDSQTVVHIIADLEKRFERDLRIFKQPKKEILVTVEANLATTATFNLRYITSEAQWQPYYNLRGQDIDKTMQLEYKAYVYNNMGINWDSIPIRLGTVNPMNNLEKPVMRAWTIQYAPQKSTNATDSLAGYETVAYLKVNEDSSSFVTIEVPNLNTEFIIPGKHSIITGAAPTLLDVTTYQIPVSYQHFCIPKVRDEVFVVGQITNLADYDLITGLASVYYGNSYIGQSYINTKNLNDTLEVSLGVDPKVKVSRVKVNKKGKKRKNGANNPYKTRLLENFNYAITVKNKRKTPINIEVWDQVPIAQEKDIVVRVKKVSGANIERSSGKLIWNTTLKPAESQKMLLSFKVKYPRAKEIELNTAKQVITPRHVPQDF